MLPIATVSFRLTTTLLTQIDHAAATRGMTRSDWMRNALLEQLQDEQQYEDLRALERRLLAQLDDMQAKIVNHVTAEIDSLTRG
jgi:metal-responsive CopG/Arc/MetJ family transcriptional regulator